MDAYKSSSSTGMKAFYNKDMGKLTEGARADSRGREE